MKIKILDPLIANQIAAGEVIERPASIVKEILENSLDAGATSLTIDVERGGMQMIRMLDNGHGIAKEDLPNAVKRHGTSKIYNLTDLSAIASLGFRGEALASICAVARISIDSAVAEASHGWQLIAEGTELTVLEKPIAHPLGTSITVRDLFFNTPARRRFLKTEKTEFSHIAEVVKRIALSRFNIAIKLNHNQRQIYHLPAATTDVLQDKRISQLCSKEFIEAALKIDMKATGLRLWGWIAEPKFYRAQADLQYLYINGRMVRDKLLTHAVRQAYQQFLTHDHYPAYVLYLECDPATVDVNVHPTKHEVRFHESRLIHDFAVVSLKKALTSTDSSTSNVIDNYKSNETTVTSRKHYHAAAPSPLAIAEQTAVYTKFQQAADIAAVDNQLILGEPLAIINEMFLITKTHQALGIVNLIKAHGLLFTQALLKKNVSSKPLLFPLTVNFSEKALQNFANHLPLLNTLGFSLEILGEKQLVVRQIPMIMDKVDAVKCCELAAETLTKEMNNTAVINTVANAAAKSLRGFETKAAQEKLLLVLSQQFTTAELKSCCQLIDKQQLARMFVDG